MVAAAAALAATVMTSDCKPPSKHVPPRNSPMRHALSLTHFSRWNNTKKIRWCHLNPGSLAPWSTLLSLCFTASLRELKCVFLELFACHSPHHPPSSSYTALLSGRQTCQCLPRVGSYTRPCSWQKALPILRTMYSSFMSQFKCHLPELSSLTTPSKINSFCHLFPALAPSLPS